jgi:uncharacterized protein (TIGR02118 family)
MDRAEALSLRPGEGSVIKLVFCLRRREGLSLEEFQTYWLETHAPLVRSHAKTLRVRRYVQTHTSRDARMNEALAGSRGASEAYDGVAELWWDSLEDFAAGASTEEGRAAARELLEDERRFIDHARSPLWIAEEHEIVTGNR